MYYILRTKVDFTFARAYARFVINELNAGRNGRGVGMITDEQEGIAIFYSKKEEIIDSVRSMMIEAGLEHYILPDIDHGEVSNSVN
jgi:hypothetical protein